MYISKVGDNNPHLIIDGDVFAYKAAAVSEHAVNFDGDNCFMLGSLSAAKLVFDSAMKELSDRFETSRMTIALSCAGANFRKNIYPAYKSNRIGKPRPVVLKFLREYIKNEYECYARYALEGDDILGILTTSPYIIKSSRKVIISVDKDMLTIPGVYYDSGKDITHTVSYDDANRHHMLQPLIGDTTDGYPGCPGIGAKGAEKVLSGCTSSYSDMWSAVIAAYHKAGLDETDALIQARMARILRNYDYDFSKKEVLPWTIESEKRRKII